MWTFTEGGNIFQSVNSAAGVAVGDIWFTDVEFEGTLVVETSHDADFVGVVFSFQVVIFILLVTYFPNSKLIAEQQPLLSVIQC